MSMNPPPPAHPVQALWCDPVEGLVARIDGVLARRGVRPARCVVLVPYAQLIGVAEAMWARCATAHGAPRFETTRNWARGMGDFTSAPHDLVFDMARDLVAAQALLAQTSFGAEKQALAGGLVELACQLAPLAAARHPDDRAAWMLALQSALRIEGDAEWFKTEGALNAIALAWVATTSYATDVLLRGPEATHVDLLIVLEGLQADPLALALCERWGEAAVRLPFPACPAPPGPARVHAAADPQDEAERAAACVMERLAEGHAAVALVATDRVLTRRIAAQLQSLGVPTHDETGWKLSTTRSAATLMGALRACAREATSDEVLDWLKGTGDLPAGEIDALETRLRREGLREWRRWSRAIAAGAREEDAALRRLTALVEARRAGLSKARALDDWLRDLRRLLEATLAWDALAADAAGAGVVAALWLDAGTDAAEGGDRGEGGPAAGGAGAAAPARRLSGGRFTLGEFTGWVRDVLEAGSFVPPAGGAASHVIVLPMQQLLGRAFDAVVMPGCDERRVPASPEPPGAWTAAQRLALGLPSREALEAAQRAAWAMALCQPRCDLLWRAADSTGEPMRPSALLQALRLDGGAVDAADPRVADPVALRPTARPAPRGDELPLATVSTSVYEDLRRCPYRFFALRQLGLRNAEEIDSQVDKRDFGNWLHAVLGHFHETLRHAADAHRTARLALIEQAAERATREAALGAAEFLPFAAAWPAVRDGYLDWLRTHEAGGAVFVESEPWMRQPLGRLELVGRLDRIDRTADGRAFVIDYKTEALKTTEDRVKDPAEDTQLAFYAALMADDTLRAAYVNVGERAPGTKTVEQPDVVAARDALVDGLMTDFARIADGAPLPPLGEGAVCDHCDARGLCRRDSWSDDAVATAPQGAGGLAGDDRVGAADVGVEPPPPEAEDLPVATAPAYEHNGRPVAREDFYRIACDPRRNVAVEACAGAGKTWMLVSRIVRALLEEGEGACEPHEILAITFTRKAAGEMGARLDQWLAQFAGQTPEVLATELVLRGMAPGAAAAAAPRLKGLYRRLLDGGRPVQFRTFHAWFAGLVRNAPMAALTALGLPAHYELLEDDAEARGQAWRPFFEAVAADADALADYRALVATHGRSQIAKALGEALTRRVEFTLSEPATAVQPFGALHPSLDGLREPADALATEAARREWLARAAALGGETNKTPQKAAEAIVEVFGGGVPAVEDGAAALARLRKAFFVAAEDRLTNHLRKYGAAQSAEAELQVLCAAQAQHAAWCHQQRMTRLARLLIDAFSEVKRRNGWIDMNDIEQAAQLLLGQSALSGWVQERLDARVAHLLIDEFQDTNPLQWQALHAWLSGYSGAGARPPGVFVVGDPKQSIYRFRRAEPQVFIAAKDFVRAGLGGELLSCDHTHRNARRVVGLVNHAMRAAQAQDQFEGFRDHSTQRADGGAVQKLPAIARDAVTALAGADPGRDDGADALRWRDSLSTPRVLPETRLLQLECEQAARWVAARIAEGVAPKEIMVLARRRSRLTAMQDALRARRIATEQPEKNDLHDASEVQDVIALVDALVSPAHDLSLARALKSPLFGLDDAALVALALRQRARPGTSWSALLGLDATAPDGGADGGRDREGDRDRFDARAPAGLDEMPDFSDVPDFEEPFEGTGRDEAAVDFSDGAGAHGPASAPAAAPAPTDASAAPLAPLPPALAAAVPVLRRWRDWLRALPPHDALSAIYEDADVLARFGAAAPPTLREGVLANLRGLLGAALDVEGGRFATPYALVRALRAGGVRAPSVAGPDAVRLLTVHGAKGLEADHVLMLDCDAAAPRGQTMGVLIEWKGDQARPGRFVFVASEKTPPACAATLLRDEQAARLREELNGLYVATTRARDRLVLSSVQPARPAEGSWWLRLQGQCEPLAAPAPVRPTGHADGDATFLLKRPPRRGLPAHPTLVPPAPREPTTSE